MYESLMFHIQFIIFMDKNYMSIMTLAIWSPFYMAIRIRDWTVPVHTNELVLKLWTIHYSYDNIVEARPVNMYHNNSS